MGAQKIQSGIQIRGYLFPGGLGNLLAGICGRLGNAAPKGVRRQNYETLFGQGLGQHRGVMIQTPPLVDHHNSGGPTAAPRGGQIAPQGNAIRAGIADIPLAGITGILGKYRNYNSQHQEYQQAGNCRFQLSLHIKSPI
jgi:hypothetical protein